MSIISNLKIFAGEKEERRERAGETVTTKDQLVRHNSQERQQANQSDICNSSFSPPLILRTIKKQL